MIFAQLFKLSVSLITYFGFVVLALFDTLTKDILNILWGFFQTEKLWRISNQLDIRCKAQTPCNSRSLVCILKDKSYKFGKIGVREHTIPYLMNSFVSTSGASLISTLTVKTHVFTRNADRVMASQWPFHFLQGETIITSNAFTILIENRAVLWTL